MAELVGWLTAQLDADEQLARAAEAEAASPWKTQGGLVCHSGPIDRYEKDDGLWDSEGCTETHHRLCMTEHVAEHVALHDPAAVLASVAAHRALLELHTPRFPDDEDYRSCPSCMKDWTDSRWEPFPCPTVRALASAFAGRSGYDPSWASA